MRWTGKGRTDDIHVTRKLGTRCLFVFECWLKVELSTCFSRQIVSSSGTQPPVEIIMFKSIIPSRRNPSFDLVIPEPVQPVLDTAQIGKENRPQHPLANMVTSPNEFKAPVLPSSKRPGSPQVSVKNQGPPRLAEAGATNRAFERMLVRLNQLRLTINLKLNGNYSGRHANPVHSPPEAHNS